ncbi:MAG: class I SAM-dependent methyltransferase [Pseudomonadota bacterium]
MGFFDFVSELDHFGRDPYPEVRLNTRYDLLVEPYREEIEGARVLDLGAKDGRWSYALAAAGASEVVAVERRASVAALIETYPQKSIRERINWKVMDVYAALEAAAAAGEKFDIVVGFSTLGNVTDPIRLSGLVAGLRPELILFDGEFIQREDAVFRVVRAKGPGPGGPEPLATVPTKGAMELMAGVNGYDVTWVNWDRIPLPDRAFIRDYYRKTKMRRETAELRRR